MFNEAKNNTESTKNLKAIKIKPDVHRLLKTYCAANGVSILDGSTSLLTEIINIKNREANTNY